MRRYVSARLSSVRASCNPAPFPSHAFIAPHHGLSQEFASRGTNPFRTLLVPSIMDSKPPEARGMPRLGVDGGTPRRPVLLRDSSPHSSCLDNIVCMLARG